MNRSSAIALTIFLSAAYLCPQAYPESSTTSLLSDRSSAASQVCLKTFSAQISGPSCPACLKQIKEKLIKMDGILYVAITPKDKVILTMALKSKHNAKRLKLLLKLDFDSNKIDHHQIAQLIKQNDFQIDSIVVHSKKTNAAKICK